MGRFIARRLVMASISVFVATFVIFVIVRIIPGDPIATMLGEEYSPEVAASLRRLYGLDQPILVQYREWITAVVQGDFGYSVMTGTSVAELLLRRVPRTLLLMAGGVAIGLMVAIPAGIFAAYYRGRWPDGLLIGMTTTLMAIPQFWLGILLLVIFAVALQWLPGCRLRAVLREPLGVLPVDGTAVADDWFQYFCLHCEGVEVESPRLSESGLHQNRRGKRIHASKGGSGSCTAERSDTDRYGHRT